MSTLTESQAANILARLAEAQRTIEAQKQTIDSLYRENEELREARADLLRSHARLFPYPVKVKRVLSAWKRIDGVIEHVVRVMPIGERP